MHRRWHRIVMCLALLVGALGPEPEAAGAARLTIVHTNDLHSHLRGHGPEADYTPLITGDDETVGGVARIAEVIRQQRQSRGEGLLVLDGGDFLMGTLFHTVSREEGGELRLMGAMGYDAVTLGNHEFDLKPQGLAQILHAAARGTIPSVVAANVLFDAQDPADDALAQAFEETGVRPFAVFRRGGIKVGVFGLMGRRAAEVAPFARPVRFGDPEVAARKMIAVLRDQEKVDLVVCISHGGISMTGEGEDAELARKAPGIDVIVSGHTHTVLPKPVVVEKTLIVQAGAYGRYVGVLDVEVEAGQCRMTRYQLIEVNDAVPGDAAIHAQVEALKDRVEKRILRPKGLGFETVLAKVDFPLTRQPWGESNLGDLVSDAIRWAVDRAEFRPGDPLSRTRVAVESNGVLRDPILPGKERKLLLCDLFRAVPLGFGPDGTMGYPLLSIYLTGAEIRQALEVLTTVAPLKGSDYVLQVSGLRFTYNPKRIPFDRVVDIWMEEGGQYFTLDTSAENPNLYKIAANLYNATFLKIIGRFTRGILTIVPKDRTGRPIDDLTHALVDGDPSVAGMQELKEWEALVAFVRQLPDADGDGLPEIPAQYRETGKRIASEPTWDPLRWIRHARWITWVTLGLAVLSLSVMTGVGWGLIRLTRRRKSRKTFTTRGIRR